MYYSVDKPLFLFILYVSEVETNWVSHFHQLGEEILVAVPWKGDKSDIIHAALKNSCSQQTYLFVREDEMFKPSLSWEADCTYF